VLIVLLSFVLGLVYFGRASRAGIEAIGRNPLAKRAIQMSIVMYVALSIVIILVGLAIAYLILIL
jgi:F0F1-type ATP synthase membrane subunit c/vacuolar-type H+-ATPase subunit K